MHSAAAIIGLGVAIDCRVKGELIGNAVGVTVSALPL